MISQQEMIEIFKTLATIKVVKSGVFQFVISTMEVPIETIIDGQIETTNVANPGDYVMKGARGEFYVLTPKQFEKNYQIVEFDEEFQIGRANVIPQERLAAQWEGDTIFFTAIWGEDMICHKGDFLVAPEDLSEVYRVEKEVFFKTYESV